MIIFLRPERQICSPGGSWQHCPYKNPFYLCKPGKRRRYVLIFLEGKSILQPYPGLPNPGRVFSHSGKTEKSLHEYSDSNADIHEN